MKDLTQFEFGGRRIRMFMRDGEPWWLAKDVTDVLGYRDTNAGTRLLDEDEKGTQIVSTPGGDQTMVVVSEAGLYRLILGARMKHDGTQASKERNAKVTAFKRWVTHDVLPSIRRHGMYATDELLDDPDHLLRVTQRLVDERKARLAAEKQVIELLPKAEFHDQVASSQGCHSVREVAKLLGTGQNRLFQWLRGQRILMADNTPYQNYLDAGYFRVIEQTWRDKSGDTHLSTKTLVTGRGLTWLERRYRQQSLVPGARRVGG